MTSQTLQDFRSRSRSRLVIPLTTASAMSMPSAPQIDHDQLFQSLCRYILSSKSIYDESTGVASIKSTELQKYIDNVLQGHANQGDVHKNIRNVFKKKYIDQFGNKYFIAWETINSSFIISLDSKKFIAAFGTATGHANVSVDTNDGMNSSMDAVTSALPSTDIVEEISMGIKFTIDLA